MRVSQPRSWSHCSASVGHYRQKLTNPLDFEMMTNLLFHEAFSSYEISLEGPYVLTLLTHLHFAMLGPVWRTQRVSYESYTDYTLYMTLLTHLHNLEHTATCIYQRGWCFISSPSAVQTTTRYAGMLCDNHK